MGLDTSSVMFLCAARSMGVDFTDTAMIGRQSFWPDPAELRRVFDVRCCMLWRRGTSLPLRMD